MLDQIKNSINLKIHLIKIVFKKVKKKNQKQKGFFVALHSINVH